MKVSRCVLLLVSMLSLNAWAVMEDAVSLQRNAQGGFDVVCQSANGLSLEANVTADAIRADQVCTRDGGVGPGNPGVLLEAGTYTTTSDFCGQTIDWQGQRILLTLASPCSGSIELDKFNEGWYRGQLSGYSYEIEVKSATSYTFYSRDFGSSGEFTKATAVRAPTGVKRTLRHGMDPAKL